MVWAQGFLIVLLVIAAAVDLRTRRIPNELVLTGLCLGAAFAIIHPACSLSAWSAGTLSGLALTLPFYALEGWGAGDVKLFAMVGGILGFPTILRALLYTLLLGGLWSLGVAIHRRQLLSTLHDLWIQLKATFNLRPRRRSKSLAIPIPLQDRSNLETLPYALAIGLGSGLALMEQWR